VIRHGWAVASNRCGRSAPAGPWHHDGWLQAPKATVQPLLINKDNAIAEYDPPRLSRGITTPDSRRQKQGSNRC